MAQDNLPYISEYADEIISGYRTLVRAPVGSGKTTLALRELPSRGRTIFITSRVATARQSLREVTGEYVRYDGLDYQAASIGQETDATTLVIATQWNIKDKIGKDPLYLSNFDYIVIDEIHCLLSDSFADSSYCLHEEIRSLPVNKHVIGLSACAEYVKDLDILQGWQWLNLTGNVRSSKPETVSTVSSANDYWSILLKSGDERRAIVFVQTVKKAYALAQRLVSVGIQSIAITSNNKDEEDKPAEKQAYNHICQTSRLPDDAWVLVTTSKLREGVNIFDERVKVVISELTDYVSLVQCPGRVRVGSFDFVVLVSKVDHNLIKDFESNLSEAKKYDATLAEVERHLVSQNDESKYSLPDGSGPITHVDEHVMLILDSVPATIKSFMVRDKLNTYPRWIVNHLYVMQDEKRKNDFAVFRNNPEKYLCRVLDTDVQTYRKMIAWRILGHLVDQDILVTDDMRLDLIAQFAAYGIVGPGAGGKTSSGSATSFVPLFRRTGIKQVTRGRKKYLVSTLNVSGPQLQDDENH